jgi:hypothetical protein
MEMGKVDNIRIIKGNQRAFPEGAGLQKALDDLLPSILNKGTWPRSQIKPIDRKCRAAIHYQGNQSYIQAFNTASTKDINVALSFPP